MGTSPTSVSVPVITTRSVDTATVSNSNVQQTTTVPQVDAVQISGGLTALQKFTNKVDAAFNGDNISHSVVEDLMGEARQVSNIAEKFLAYKCLKSNDPVLEKAGAFHTCVMRFTENGQTPNNVDPGQLTTLMQYYNHSDLDAAKIYHLVFSRIATGDVLKGITHLGDRGAGFGFVETGYDSAERNRAKGMVTSGIATGAWTWGSVAATGAAVAAANAWNPFGWGVGALLGVGALWTMAAKSAKSTYDYANMNKYFDNVTNADVQLSSIGELEGDRELMALVNGEEEVHVASTSIEDNDEPRATESNNDSVASGNEDSNNGSGRVALTYYGA